MIFTAPSGAGKTTIVGHLLKKYSQLAFSISATTRSPRKGEIHGKDYYFLSLEEWNERVEKGDFLEWEEVYPNQYYGTLKSEVERLWDLGKIVIFDVEVKGAANIKKHYGEQALAVFVKPPSIEVLLERLKGRKTETPENVKKRMDRAILELTYEDNFDAILLNDKLELALQNAENILKKHIV